MAQQQEEQVVTTQLGAWWSTKNPFQEPQAVESGCYNPDSKKAIGGAKAQSRFSGKTATPLYQAAAVSSHTLSATDQKSDFLALAAQQHDVSATQGWNVGVGRRCDGLEGDVGKNVWVWSTDAWCWCRSEEGSRLSSDFPEATADIAARRIGDGRDGLGDIVHSMNGSNDVSIGKQPKAHSHAVASGRSISVMQDTSDIPGGFSSVRQQLYEQIVFPLKYRSLCMRMGISAGRGTLVTGPSGSGKTTLIHHICQSSGFPFVSVSGPECVGSDIAENRLKKAFQNAKSSQPSILFIDNIEAAAPNREKQTTNQIDSFSSALLVSLVDSLRKENACVSVVCASSMPEKVDPSLRRPFRLDTEIYIGAPSPADRERILTSYTSRMPLDSNVQLADIARRLHGFMAADVAAVAREAALACIVEAIAGHIETNLERIKPVANQEHFETAVGKLKPSILRNWGGFHQDSLPDVSFQEIGGLDDAKRELRELIDWPIMYPRLLNKFGSSWGSGGVLLYGPPGSGKTLLAKAVAFSCQANFLSVNGPELLQMWMGESERNIRELFAAARFSAPSVIFLDEVDALAPRRSNGSGARSMDGDIASRIVGQLLCEMDGISKDSCSGVIVIAATNRPAAVDSAMLRPGRLTHMVYCPLPEDTETHASILKNAFKNCPQVPDLNLEKYVETHSSALEGFSGADLVELAKRAKQILIRESIAAESAGNPHAAESLRLDQSYLDIALSTMHRSVSKKQAAYYSDLSEKIKHGKSLEDAMPAEHIPLRVAVRMAQDAAASKTRSLQARVEQLEQLLQASGVKIPEDVENWQGTNTEGSPSSPPSEMVDQMEDE